MVAYPKLPSRKEEKERKRQLLKQYRDRINLWVIQADKFQCRHCGAFSKDLHAHHVYGRGNNPDHWKERHDSRLTLCDACHYQHHHQGGLTRAELIEDLERAIAQRPDYPGDLTGL